MLGFVKATVYPMEVGADGTTIQYKAKGIEVEVKQLTPFTKTIDPLTRLQKKTSRARFGLLDDVVTEGDRIIIGDKKYLVVSKSIKSNPSLPSYNLFYIDIEG
jgi:hypothetical protein